MADLFRDALIGHLIRLLTAGSGKLLPYTDEEALTASNRSTLQDKTNDKAENRGAESTPGIAEDIVGWYNDHDQDNPQNWSLQKRIFVLAQIMFLNFSGVLVTRMIYNAIFIL